MHCEPKASFIGGGLWCPEKGSIDKLRRSIDLHPERWRRVLSGPLFRKVFLPGVKANASPDAAVKAFVDKNQDNALKKRPMVSWTHETRSKNGAGELTSRPGLRADTSRYCPVAAAELYGGQKDRRGLVLQGRRAGGVG